MSIVSHQVAAQMTTVAQRIEQFHIKHSEDGDPIEFGGWIYYPDGARRESNPYGALCEPPRDDARRVDPTYWNTPAYELWRRIWQYREAKLIRATEEFDRAKQAALADANGYTRREATLAALRRLERNVKRLKEARDEAADKRDAADARACARRKPTAADLAHEQRVTTEQMSFRNAVKEIEV